MTLQIHLTSPSWKETANGIKQRGTCWDSPVQLLEVSSNTEIGQALEQQNGFYALIWERGSLLYAAVDHIRSIPLFYALKGSDFFLSDDAEWVREQVGNTTMDEVAKEEFQLTGYVTGQDTLYPDVKQLQAGEFLSINTSAETPQLKTERYYRFLHTEPESYDQQDLYKKLDAAALASIDNLIRYANGRQIVIPLSGGYDSRLIATLLKRRGYENILTFTYGVPGNKESAYSKKVADALSLKWHFVEYNNALWREAWQTEERLQYQKWASGWNSIAHVQDWLAVKILKKKNIIENDCIFVPGHTGDFISGGHIPDNVIKNQTSSLEELFKAIKKKHYSIAPSEIVTKRGELEWSKRLLDRAEQSIVANGEDLANGFEKWEWQERQAKFICNSVRVYEFYGYDWWMPLWDMEFVQFWQAAPLEFRKGSSRYIQFVKEVYINESSFIEEINNSSDSSMLTQNSKKLLKFILPDNLVVFLKGVYRKRISKTHHLGFWGAFDREEVVSLLEQGFAWHGVRAKAFLKDFEINEQ